VYPSSGIVILTHLFLPILFVYFRR